MARSVYRSHLLVLPLVILSVVLVEQFAEYQLRTHVESIPLRTLGIMLCYAVGFSFAADRVSPWLKRLIVVIRSRSRKGGGRLGVWAFFVLCYLALFFAYMMIEAHGPEALFSSSRP